MCPIQLGFILRKRSSREGLSPRKRTLSLPDLFRSCRLGPNGGIGKREPWLTIMLLRRPTSSWLHIAVVLYGGYLARTKATSAVARFLQTARSPRLQSTKSSVIGACRWPASCGDAVYPTIHLFQEMQRSSRENVPGYREIYRRVPMDVRQCWGRLSEGVARGRERHALTRNHALPPIIGWADDGFAFHLLPSPPTPPRIRVFCRQSRLALSALARPCFSVGGLRKQLCVDCANQKDLAIP
jgi:hypothetical protein